MLRKMIVTHVQNERNTFARMKISLDWRWVTKDILTDCVKPVARKLSCMESRIPTVETIPFTFYFILCLISVHSITEKIYTEAITGNFNLFRGTETICAIFVVHNKNNLLTLHLCHIQLDSRDPGNKKEISRHFPCLASAKLFDVLTSI